LPSITKARAKALRQQFTDAEAKLWFYLRARRLAGLKFRRQHPFPPYIVDFYCGAAKLVVEVDGSQHCEKIDSVRDLVLNKMGLKVIRFWDNDVLQKIEAVLVEIMSVAQNQTLTPTPLPKGEGIEC